MKKIIALFALLFSLEALSASQPCTYGGANYVQCFPRNFRVGSPGGSFGTITHSNELEFFPGVYRDSSGTAKAIASSTGYTQVNIARTTAAGSVAFGVYTNYQDAQTADASLVGTNEKAPLKIYGNGVVDIKGRVDGNNVSAGNVGEFTEISHNFTSTTSADYVVSTAKSVPAGTYMVQLCINATGASSNGIIAWLNTSATASSVSNGEPTVGIPINSAGNISAPGGNTYFCHFAGRWYSLRPTTTTNYYFHAYNYSGTAAVFLYATFIRIN